MAFRAATDPIAIGHHFPRVRVVLGIVMAAVLVACGNSGEQPADTPSTADPKNSARPHVILIVADDLGWADVGFAGGGIATPHLTRLAEQSLILDRFYAAPMCSPSRAQLMTSRHALSMGMTRNVKPRDKTGLPLGIPTLPGAMADAGYETALVGKWHLGHGSPALQPRGRGFHRSYGHMRGWIDYHTHFVDGALDWHRDGQPLQEEGYTTDLIAQEAQRVLAERSSDKPLFMVVAFNAPHAPLQAADSDVAAAPTNARATYIKMVQRLDERIGDILGSLDEQGMAENTIVWFLSDNGANPKYGGSNAPLRGGKYTCHEGALRVPACVRYPGHLPLGISQTFVGTVDVAPTVLAWAGGTPLEGAQGKDARGRLAGTNNGPMPPYLFAVDHAKAQRRAILSPPWKLIHEVQGGRVTESLYQVIKDPLEENDRLAQEPAQAARLRALAPW